MIESLPSWTIDRPAGALAWPNPVRLAGRFLVSPSWYCLNRDDGTLVWHRNLPIVNAITGIHDGLILCKTLVPGSKQIFGAAAVRLADGELIWAGFLWPVLLRKNEFLCIDGTVRDLQTARVIGQRPALSPNAALIANQSLLSALWSSKVTGRGPLELAPGIFVAGEVKAGRIFTATDADGRKLWRYSPTEAGWYCFSSGAENFVTPPYIYFLVSKKPHTRRISNKQFAWVPAQRYLLTFDIRLGKVVQELDLGVWKGFCGINDIDQDGAILSFEENVLAYYPRLADKNRAAGA